MVDVNVKGVLYGNAATLAVTNPQVFGEITNVSSISGGRRARVRQVPPKVPPCTPAVEGPNRSEKEQKTPQDRDLAGFLGIHRHKPEHIPGARDRTRTGKP